MTPLRRGSEEDHVVLTQGRRTEKTAGNASRLKALETFLVNVMEKNRVRVTLIEYEVANESHQY